MTRLELAYNTGDSDAYYGRHPIPRIKAGLHRREIPISEMTAEEIREFWRGYEENPTDRKDWG